MLHQSSAVSTMSETEILRRYANYDADIISLREAIPAVNLDTVAPTMSETEILKRFQSYDEEIASLKLKVSTMEQKHETTTQLVTTYQEDITKQYNETQKSMQQQHEATTHLVTTYQENITQQHNETMKSLTKFKRTTNARIESSNEELRACIKQRSRKETRIANKTQETLRLLLQERKIDYNEPQDDDLDDCDDDEFFPDPMDDPDDQYDSADEDFYDDEEEMEEYDDSQPYVTPNFSSQRPTSPSDELDKKNIIHSSRTRSQSNKSQSQGVAGSR
jgi:hypothetical protein